MTGIRMNSPRQPLFRRPSLRLQCRLHNQLLRRREKDYLFADDVTIRCRVECEQGMTFGFQLRRAPLRLCNIRGILCLAAFFCQRQEVLFVAVN